jgi:hypothetical protein
VAYAASGRSWCPSASISQTRAQVQRNIDVPAYLRCGSTMAGSLIIKLSACPNLRHAMIRVSACRAPAAERSVGVHGSQTAIYSSKIAPPKRADRGSRRVLIDGGRQRWPQNGAKSRYFCTDRAPCRAGGSSYPVRRPSRLHRAIAWASRAAIKSSHQSRTAWPRRSDRTDPDGHRSSHRPDAIEDAARCGSQTEPLCRDAAI